MGQPGLFDLDERYAALSKRGDPLERLAAVVDFEMFRADLGGGARSSDRSRGGRLPMDAVMMFQVLVLQALYGLADEQTEFQMRDRLNFVAFSGSICTGGCRTPARSGCSGNCSPGPRRSTPCSPGLTRICVRPAIWPWARRGAVAVRLGQHAGVRLRRPDDHRLFPLDGLQPQLADGVGERLLHPARDDRRGGAPRHPPLHGAGR